MEILSGFQDIAPGVVKIVFDVRHILVQIHLLIQCSVFLRFYAGLPEIFVVYYLVNLGIVELDVHHNRSEEECRWEVPFDEGKCLLVSIDPADIDPGKENSSQCCISYNILFFKLLIGYFRFLL